MQQTRRSFLTQSVSAGLALLIPGIAVGLPMTGGNAFGSYWRLVTNDIIGMQQSAARISAIVEAVDAAMSPYRSTSELSQLNRHKSRDWIELSSHMAEVLEAALETSRRSDGAFDPTVGPLVGRYGFGPIHGLRIGDASDLEIDNGCLRKAKPDLTIDLCGIAKGWALDLMAAELDRAGVGSYLIELGGEVLARGQHPDGRPWRIAIEGTGRLLQPGDLAVATSGLTAQSYWLGSQQFGHIIDPNRNAPATGDLLSVTVLNTSAMAADAWATALFSLGAEKAQVTAEALGLDTVFVLKDGSKTKVLASGFQAAARLH